MPDNCDGDGVQVRAELGPGGRQEFGDPVPMAPPVDFRQPPSLIEMIRTFVKHEMSNQAAELGFESFEESEDFDIPDDPLDPHTPYEAVFDPPLPEQKQAVAGMTGKRAPEDVASPPPAPAAPKPEATSVVEGVSAEPVVAGKPVHIT